MKFLKSTLLAITTLVAIPLAAHATVFDISGTYQLNLGLDEDSSGTTWINAGGTPVVAVSGTWDLDTGTGISNGLTLTLDDYVMTMDIGCFLGACGLGIESFNSFSSVVRTASGGEVGTLAGNTLTFDAGIDFDGGSGSYVCTGNSSGCPQGVGTVVPVAPLGLTSTEDPRTTPPTLLGINAPILSFALDGSFSTTMDVVRLGNAGPGQTQRQWNTFSLTATPVPEPGTALLFGAGLLGLAVMGSIKRKKS